MLPLLRRALKPFVPRAVLDLRLRLVVKKTRQEFSKLGTQAAFEKIYAENAWGGTEGDFNSGLGSGDDVTAGYVAVVTRFIAERSVRSVADLGCGDFRVGRRLVSPGLQYTGVDIVPALIERNQRLFGGDQVRFEHRNLIEDALPEAELGLLRQVLQHLSNQQIAQVLKNTQRYRYLIVTEHLPLGEGVVPNLDKPHGPDIRLYDRSGVFLDQPPFSQPTKILAETQPAPGEVLRTVLLERG